MQSCRKGIASSFSRSSHLLDSRLGGGLRRLTYSSSHALPRWWHTCLLRHSSLEGSAMRAYLLIATPLVIWLVARVVGRDLERSHRREFLDAIKVPPTAEALA